MRRLRGVLSRHCKDKSRDYARDAVEDHLLEHGLVLDVDVAGGRDLDLVDGALLREFGGVARVRHGDECGGEGCRRRRR